MKKLIIVILCFMAFGCTKNNYEVNYDEKINSISLELLGENEITLNYNEKFNEPGFEAKDNEGNRVNDLVKVNGKVINRPGEYTITYELNVNDEKIVKERKVVVKKIADEENASFIPVLMYHYFYDDEAGETGSDGNYLAKSLFEEQLKYLKDNNYYFPTMEELNDYVDGNLNLPSKSIILTMDDGAESNYRIAYPLALEYEIPIVWFVVTSWTDPNLPYQQEIINSGYVSMESHTNDMHRAGCPTNHGGIFQCISREEAINDLTTSKQMLKTATTLAYPFGDYNDFTKEVLKEAGYNMAFTTEWGVVKPGMDKYALPRIRISDGNSLETFIASIS